MNRFYLLILTLLFLLLSACGGTLEIDMAGEGAAADPPVSDPATELPSHIPLTSYSDSRHGFILPVPQDAVVEEYDDLGSYAQGFIQADESFSLLVQMHDDVPADVRDPAALLRHIFATDTLPAGVTPLDNGDLAGGWLALPPEPGEQCAESVPVTAAFVGANRAFSLLIRSDAPGRCDAAGLPETQAILAGFRLDPAAIAMMTPTPVPEPPVQVAYLREGNVWLWTEGEGRFTLFEEQGAEGPLRLHPQGKWVAFLRDGHLWVVSRDGDDERALTTGDTFAGHSLPGGAAIEALGFRPYHFAWLPGSDLLLFNTSPILEGPGLLLSDDLWQVDVASGEVTNLLPAGAGGTFTLSPGGRQLVLVRPDVIEVADVDGGNRRRLLSYEPVLTYSEYRYYATPVWSPDGTALRVAIPPADPLADLAQGTAIWHLSLSGTPARLLGEIPASPLPPGANIALAPDLGSVAFLRAREEGSGVFDLLLAPLGDSVGDPAVYAEDVETIDGWSPDGATFLFTPAFNGTPRLLLGRPGSAAQPAGNPAAAVTAAQWAGPGARDLVYLQRAGDAWELWLDPAQGEARVLDTVPGAPPDFDTR